MSAEPTITDMDRKNAALIAQLTDAMALMEASNRAGQIALAKLQRAQARKPPPPFNVHRALTGTAILIFIAGFVGHQINPNDEVNKFLMYGAIAALFGKMTNGFGKPLPQLLGFSSLETEYDDTTGRVRATDVPRSRRRTEKEPHEDDAADQKESPDGNDR